MKTSTEDKTEGKYHKAKGEIKESMGELTKDKKLEAEGTVEKIEGETQEQTGKIKKVFGN